MTARVDFKAKQSVAWTSVHEEDGRTSVVLMMSGDFSAYMTPEATRMLAADLLSAADRAESKPAT